MCCCCGILGGCLGSLFGGCCCSGLQQCNVKRGAASRIPYVFLMFIFCIFAIIMSLYGEKALYSSHLLHFKLTVCNSVTCEGNGSVYRTSFVLFVFFIIHAIMVWFMRSFHWIFFTCKFIILIGFLTATFWIPNSFFDGYAEFARVASIIFLLLQVIVLISWAWDVNEKVVNKINELDQGDTINSIQQENNPKNVVRAYQCLLIFGTLLLYGACIVLWIFMFRWFDKSSSCSFNQTVISITIVLAAIITILPPLIKTGSIFTTGIVSFYITYLCYAGLSNYPRHQCNPFFNERNTVSLWIGIVIAAISISYAGFGISKHDVLFPEDYDNQRDACKNNNNEQRIDDEDDDEDVDLQVTTDNKKNNNNYDDDDETRNLENQNNNNNNIKNTKSSPKANQGNNISKDKLEQKANILFYVCMAFASIYICMLFTNWETNVTSSSRASSKGKVSLWVNIGAEWVSFILCIWTIIAPKLCPHRFGIEESE